mmetsp:Transcript_57311/g.129836  ORF Transcript_57311/g.129836 Transcript_57311/m.129836 type:complete len:202 (-) Transcript_57311:127-732(-)
MLGFLDRRKRAPRSRFFGAAFLSSATSGPMLLTPERGASSRSRDTPVSCVSATLAASSFVSSAPLPLGLFPWAPPREGKLVDGSGTGTARGDTTPSRRNFAAKPRSLRTTVTSHESSKSGAEGIGTRTNMTFPPDIITSFSTTIFTSAAGAAEAGLLAAGGAAGILVAGLRQQQYIKQDHRAGTALVSVRVLYRFPSCNPL